VSSKHIVIVGAGVVGLCTAYYCVRRGCRVTVIERGGPEHDCCSLGNAGYISPSHFVPLAAPGMVTTGLRMMWNQRSPFYIKPRLDRDLLRWAWEFMRACTPERAARAAPVLRDLNLASRACYQALADERGNDFGLQRAGLFMLCKTAEKLAHEKELGEEGRKLGVPGELLTPEETAKLEPTMKMDIAGSVYFPDDCHLSPMKFVPGLAATLAAEGVEFLWSREVRGWSGRNGVIDGVRTAAGGAVDTGGARGESGGEVSGDEYVIAGGSWSPVIARSLDADLPMQAGKGYSLTIPKPRALPRASMICTEARVAVTPMGGALRFGGTMEIAGLNERINPERVRGIMDAAPRYFPEFSDADFAGVKPWRGLRPCTPDGLPYVGRLRSYSNLSVATGHAMLGMSLGPITGKLMSQILAGEKPEIDTALLNPDRYAR